jgi:hypothetical protein
MGDRDVLRETQTSIQSMRDVNEKYFVVLLDLGAQIVKLLQQILDTQPGQKK